MRVDEHTGCSQSLDTVPLRQGGLSRSAGYTVCVPPRIVERRSSATRLASPPAGTFLTGSSTPTTIIWRAFFSRTRPTSLWLRWTSSRSYPPSIRSISFWNQESRPTLSSTLRSWLRISNPIVGSDPAGPLLQTFLGKLSGETRGTISFLVDLNRRVRNEIDYVTRLDPGVQTCEQTLEKCTGSCRDSAWLARAGSPTFGNRGTLRLRVSDSVGVGRRERREVRTVPKPTLRISMPGQKHFLPGAGWIGMDPTSGLFAGEGHIPLVCTPNASKAGAHRGHGRAGQRGLSLLHVHSPLE